MGVVRNAAIHAIDGLWHVAETARGLALAPRIAAEEPYGSGPRKPYARRLADTAVWALRHHEPHEFYNLYGMDALNSNVDYDSFLDNHSFMITRDHLNLGGLANQAAVLRDKRLFGMCMDAAGAATPHNFGIMRIEDGARRYLDISLSNPIDPQALPYPLFAKANDGKCGEGIVFVHSFQELDQAPLGTGDYLIQQPVVQHPDMNQLGPGSVNTCRIATILSEGHCRVLAAIVRCSCAGTGSVDNTSAGGIAVGVDEQGRLRRLGYRDPEFGGCLDTHPDTGVRFEGFQIPDYQEAVELVTRAHLSLPDVGSIGWDVAFSTDGPTLIEGNDNWEIHSLQMCNEKGLRPEWDEFVARRSAELPAQYRHIHV